MLLGAQFCSTLPDYFPCNQRSVFMSLCNKLHRRGFTLTEALVVIAIVSILLGLAIPAVQSIRESARNVACLNNLKQIAIGAHLYESQFKRLPPGTIGYKHAVNWNDFRNVPTGVYWKNKQHTSCLAILLPFLEYKNLIGVCDRSVFDTRNDLLHYRQLGNDIGWFGDIEGFAELSAQQMPIFACPSDSIQTLLDVSFTGGSQPVTIDNRDAMSYLAFLDTEKPGKYIGTNYLGCSGAISGGLSEDKSKNMLRGAMSSGEKMSLKDIRDGLSNTFMFGESIGEIEQKVRVLIQPWNVGGLARGRGRVRFGASKDRELLGNPSESSVFGFGSFHSSSVNFAYVDGSVKSCSQEISNDVLLSLCGIADGSID